MTGRRNYLCMSGQFYRTCAGIANTMSCLDSSIGKGDCMKSCGTCGKDRSRLRPTTWNGTGGRLLDVGPHPYVFECVTEVQLRKAAIGVCFKQRIGLVGLYHTPLRAA